MTTVKNMTFEQLLATRDLRYYGIREQAWNRAEEFEMMEKAVEAPVEQNDGLVVAWTLAYPHMTAMEQAEVTAKMRRCPPRPVNA